MTELPPASPHLDSDTLAGVLGGEPAPVHLGSCVACSGSLDELREASAQVARRLRALPAPAVPDDLADRLSAALEREGARPSPAPAVTTLPVRGPRRDRAALAWLAVAAVTVGLLAAGGLGVALLRGGASSSSSSQSAAGADRAAAPARPPGALSNVSGLDYGADGTALRSALPALLAGQGSALSTRAGASPQQGSTSGGSAPAPPAAEQTRSAVVPAALARLRAPEALARCLSALLPPDDDSVRPLALDYARYRGQPALAVVLPAAAAGTVDVYFVRPSCDQADEQLIVFQHVRLPAGG